MKTREITTTDLANFGYSERKELINLLCAWHSQVLPDDFDDDGVKPMFNRDSGYVFKIMKGKSEA